MSSDALYPSMAEQPPPAAHPPATGSAEVAEAMYPTMRPEPVEPDAAEFAGAMRKLGAPPEYADDALAEAALLEAYREGKTATPEQHREWQMLARLKIAREHGWDEVKPLLAEAAAIVRRDPKLHKMMSSGAGDHPRAVGYAVRLALAERKAKGRP